MTVHLVPNAGDPQTEPGRWPMRLADGHTLWTWAKYRGRIYCHTWHLPARSDFKGGWVCRGCLATHRTLGGRVMPHTPSPPQHHWCPWCNEPLVPPSYTDAGHPWCGGDGDGGYGEEL